MRDNEGVVGGNGNEATQVPLVYPVVLGAGDRLFGEAQDKIALRLVESRSPGGGVVKMIYAPAMADG